MLGVERTQFAAVRTSVFSHNGLIRVRDAYFCFPTQADEAMPGCEDRTMTESHNSALMDSPSPLA